MNRIAVARYHLLNALELTLEAKRRLSLEERVPMAARLRDRAITAFNNLNISLFDLRDAIVTADPGDLSQIERNLMQEARRLERLAADDRVPAPNRELCERARRCLVEAAENVKSARKGRSAPGWVTR